MGLDCVLIVDSKRYSLDRWYVFNEYFEPKVVYAKNKALKILNKAIGFILSNDDINKEYHLRWAKEAFNKINQAEEDRIIFYTEQNNEYYE